MCGSTSAFVYSVPLLATPAQLAEKLDVPETSPVDGGGSVGVPVPVVVEVSPPPPEQAASSSAAASIVRIG